MRHKSLIAALLLPVPFAALPVIAVMVSQLGGGGGPTRIAINPAPIEQRLNQADTTGHTLAHNVTDTHAGCSDEYLPPVEG